MVILLGSQFDTGVFLFEPWPFKFIDVFKYFHLDCFFAVAWSITSVIYISDLVTVFSLYLCHLFFPDDEALSVNVCVIVTD